MFKGHHLGKPIGGGEENFDFWRGPIVDPPADASERQKRAFQGVQNEFQSALRRSFTSTNYVKEVVRREVTSCTASMTWTLLDISQQAVLKEGSERTTLEDEADDLAQDWWRKHGKGIEKAIRDALMQARTENRAALRFRVAGGLLRDDGKGGNTVRTDLDRKQMAKFIRLEHLPSPENALIWEDPDTFLKSAAYSYTDARGTDCVETCHCQEEGGKTLLRIVRATDQQPTSGVELDLGERITYIELSVDPLITPQFLQNQMAYNTASTMILRNTELAGFLERYGINIEPPFEMVENPNKPGEYQKVYTSAKPGPGMMMAWQQTTIEKRDGNNKIIGEEPIGAAQYGKFDPASPDALISATTHNLMNMYSEVGQVYVLMGKDSVASGRSREVAMSDFDNMRQPTIDLAEFTIGEVLETFLALIAALSGQPGRYASIQVDGQVKRRVIPPSPEDRKADREDVAAEIISKAQARQRQGDDDPDQTDAQIQREKKASSDSTTTPASNPVKAAVKKITRKGRKA